MTTYTGDDIDALPEPILHESLARLMLYPIRDDECWELYHKALASFWTPQEINLSQDLIHWKQLKPTEQHLFSMILAFFASSDAIVTENLLSRFCTEVKLPEACSFYTFQSAMENIHSETYALLIDTLVPDAHDRLTLFRAIETVDCVKLKAEWALRWVSSDAPFGQRLVAFAAVEGIFFSGSFAAIFWLKSRGLLPVVTFSNELISRDEALHTQFACFLYTRLIHPVPAGIILDIIVDACEVEFAFWRHALPEALSGINCDLMIQYIKFVADRLLVDFGIHAHFRTTNPFAFMEFISLEGKTNFFERRVSEYSRAGVMSGNNVTDTIL
ncbi:ribonucleotide reductase small subunit [Hymenopellis radicata]|nr:ribonucleotide reductase small subunit [Hymenopellis radicata]